MSLLKGNTNFFLFYACDNDISTEFLLFLNDHYMKRSPVCRQVDPTNKNQFLNG